MTEPVKPQPESRPSVWAPLHHPVFRALWIAGLVSDFGAWMHELANETGEPEVRHLIAVTEEDGDDSS